MSEVGDTKVVEELVSRLNASLTFIGTQVTKVAATGNAEQLKRLRSVILNHGKSVGLVVAEVDGQTRPKVGDTVLGVTVIHHGNVGEGVNFPGRITGVDDHDCVNIEFGICEGTYDPQLYVDADVQGDRDEFLAAIARHTGRYLTVHAADLRLMNGKQRWIFNF